MNNTDRIVLIILFTLINTALFSQEITQTIRGTVIDKQSRIPLTGATVILLNTDPVVGITTDKEGNFVFKNVPLGRQSVMTSYVGYSSSVKNNLIVSSGKEVVLEFELEERITEINELDISWRKKSEYLNQMAATSARTFTVEETRRYAGGLDDPARMASSFAGVAMSSITDNGIVIRGNSAKGVSWRLEGVDIPNPNHFAGASVAGGGIVTVFSAQMLANSDFFTGAFPAEYGNAVAGVFDIKFRKGNNEKREYTVQMGVLGLDLSSEGPFTKGRKSSYLFNYRYSTFGMVQALLPNNMGIPQYQDLSFKLNFPNKHGYFSIWGIGSSDFWAKSKLDSSVWKISADRDYFNWNLRMGAAGISNNLITGKKTYLRSNLAITGTYNAMDAKRLDFEMTGHQNWFLEDYSSKIILNSFINHKINEHATLRSGINYQFLFFNLNLNATMNNIPSTFQNFVDQNGKSSYGEYYAQLKYDFTDKLTLNGGFNAMYFMLNQNYSVDPRLSLKWFFKPDQSISFGYGKHSQLEEFKIYLINKKINNKTTYPNKNIELSHSKQFVISYDWMINENLRLKIEPYYQHLYNYPGIPDSSYSMINFNQDWTFRDSLINNSKGRNYGVDLTFERFLHEGYYYLLTASIFDSRYRGGDDVWRNTRYNKNFVVNMLFGKEYYRSRNRVFGANFKLNYMGGDRSSPVLTTESIINKRVIYDESKSFSKRLPSTYNLDITLTFRKNKETYSRVWAFQLKNILASPMYSGYDYYYKDGEVKLSKSVIILPVISYKIEF
jgi:hypothetical protein